MINRLKGWWQGDEPLSTEEQDMSQNSEMEKNEVGGNLCEICQGIPSHRCPQCQNKVFCSDCDEQWHRHPQRKNHRVVVLSSNFNRSVILPMNSEVKKRWSQIDAASGRDGQLLMEKAIVAPDLVAPLLPLPKQESNSTNMTSGMPERTIVTMDRSLSASRMSLSSPPQIIQELDRLESESEKLNACRKELDKIWSEIRMCDAKIDAGFEEDPEFFDETDEFQKLNQQKVALTKDKVQLQKYQKSLRERRSSHETAAAANTSTNATQAVLEKPGASKEVEDQVTQEKYGATALKLSSDPDRHSSVSSTDSGNFVMQPSGDMSLHGMKPTGQQPSSNPSTSATAWICAHCTYHNAPEQKTCEMCYRETPNAEFVYESGSETSTASSPTHSSHTHSSPSKSTSAESTSTDTMEVAEAMKKIPEEMPGMAAAAAVAPSSSKERHSEDDDEKENESSIFCDIAAEKQKAWERFREKERLREQGIEVHDEYDEGESAAASPHYQSTLIVSEAERKEQARKKWEEKQALKAAGLSTEEEPEPKEEQYARHKLVKVVSLRESDEYKKHEEMMLRKPRGHKTDKEDDKSSERILMKTEAQRVTRLYKWAEKYQLSLADVDLAMTLEVVDCERWLQQILPEITNRLLCTARLKGYSAPESLVREALRKCIGDEELALQYVSNYCTKFVERIRVLFVDQFTLQQIKEVCNNSCYDEDKVIGSLNQRVSALFLDRSRKRSVMDSGDLDPMYSTVTDPVLQDLLSNKNESKERRARAALIEHHLQGWGRAEMIVELIDELYGSAEGLSVEDIVRTVKQHEYITKEQAKLRLQEECNLCFCEFPPSQLTTLSLCQCKLCMDCLRGHFEVVIRERHIKNLPCPNCQSPDLQNGQQEDVDNYFQFLAVLLPNLVSPEILALYHEKLNHWKMQQDQNFRWCSNDHCQFGFVWESPHPKMRCDKCKNCTCFKCKLPWQPQHDGISCEQFKQWLEDNDPEYQAHGLAKHLELNGIACPKCKFRYSLAKGGCMHFTCTQCGHEFCCGCNRPFIKQGICKEYQACLTAGLHCHHPRDCLYYLRDKTIEELKGLLQEVDLQLVVKNQDEDQENDKCTVMEQKETQDGLVDEACGKELYDNTTLLCQNHYKEYLVSIINKKKIDPLPVMELQELKMVFTRCDKQVPKRKQNATDEGYKKRLIEIIRRDFPLTPQ